MGSIMEIMVKHSQLHQMTFKFKFIKCGIINYKIKIFKLNMGSTMEIMVNKTLRL